MKNVEIVKPLKIVEIIKPCKKYIRKNQYLKKPVTI
jgi:hypothetical protein